MDDNPSTRAATLDPDDPGRQAMRAFLQRAEVRLSTMQRIGGLFVSGAGLLFLFPVFFKDAFLEILRICLTPGQSVALRFFTLPLLIPVGVSLALPLYSFYALLKDLVLFYFTPQHYGQNGRWFNPRFVLSGIAFSKDESAVVKEAILHEQRSEPSLQYFVLSQHEAHREPLQRIYNVTGQEIISEERRRPTDDPRSDATLLSVAFALAGTVDRSLALEVAKMEASLVRHALALRSLVLRYAKALLLFTWTTVIALLVAGTLHSLADQGTFLQAPKSGAPPLGGSAGEQFWLAFQSQRPAGFALFQIIAVAVLYTLWAWLTPFIIRRPMRWIYELGDKNKSLRNADVDEQLFRFEQRVIKWCRVTVIVWSIYWALLYWVLIGVHAYLTCTGWFPRT
jgi:hypothetical protein